MEVWAAIYNWSTSTGSAQASGAITEDVTGLAAGSYSVRVEDGNGCVKIDSTVLTEPSAISFSGVATEYAVGEYFSCDTCNDGVYSLTVSGGVGLYAYSWGNGQTTAAASGLAPNTYYTFTITDSEGCARTDSVLLPANIQTSSLELFGTLSSYSGGHQVSTYGGSNGWINLQVVGGTSPYSYAWSNGASTRDISGLAVGTYTVVVTDAAQQQAEKSFTLNGPANPLSATLMVQNPNCPNVNSGQLSASVSGATPPYTYLWSTTGGSAAANEATASSITQLSAGIYSVLIRDANNDSLLVSDTIVSPTEIQSSVVASVNEQGYHLLCAEGSSVTLDLSASGGTPPYTYQWDNGKFTQDIAVTAGGLYTVMVKDGLNCVKYDSLLVNAPSAIEMAGADWYTYPNGQLFSCDTCNDAQVTVNYLGGVPPYNMLLSSATQTLSGPTFAGIYADTIYIFYLEDAIGCVLEDEEGDKLTIPREGFSSLGVGVQLSQYPGGYNVSSFGGSDGWIDLNVYGEMSQTTSVWSDGTTGRFRGGLMAGTYEVTVSDNAGQSITKTITLTQPQNNLMVQLSGQFSSCSASGNINAMVNGGTPPYSYYWYGPNGQLPNEQWSTINVWQQGMYSLWVKDANNDSTFTEIPLYPGPSLWTEVSSPVLYGNANAGCNINDGSIVIQFHGGQPPYQVSLRDLSYGSLGNVDMGPSPNSNSGAEAASGNFFTTNDSILVIDSLRAGNYYVEVSDMSNCGGQGQDIELTSPPPIQVQIVPQTLPNGYYLSCDTCNDASAQLEVTGAYGSLQCAWAQVPEEFVPMRLQGASIFTKFEDGDVDPTDLFGGNIPFVIGSNAQQSGLAGDVMYAAFAMDELGCTGGESFTLETPNAVVIASPVWGLFGNDANGALIPPSGGGGAAWLGTNDSTDFVMKVNGEPQLKLGADGSTEVMSGLILSGISTMSAIDLTSAKWLVEDEDGSVASFDPSVAVDPVYFPFQPYPCIQSMNGFIPFWSNGVNKLFVNDCAGAVNVGIGTDEPATRLDVRGTGHFQTSIGIGTLEPLAGLDVRQSGILVGYRTSSGPSYVNAMLDVRGSTDPNGFTFDALDMAGRSAFRVRNNGKVIVGDEMVTQTGDRATLYLGGESYHVSAIQGRGISLGTSGTDDALFVEQGSGDVGIGTTTPTAPLEIKNNGEGSSLKIGVSEGYRYAIEVFQDGTQNFMVRGDGYIYGRELNVQVGPFPDYVFQTEYDLMPLSELETYVKKNSHLPEIPSAKEVEENGMNVGEMNTLLLKKVEELTLYLIEQEKQLELLKEQVNNMKQK